MKNLMLNVSIDNRSWELLTVGFGVPQGSIFNPVLFNLWVADLQRELNVSTGIIEIYLYPADSVIHLLYNRGQK